MFKRACALFDCRMRVDLYRFGSKHNEVYVDKSRKRCYTVGDKKHFLPPINASNSKVGNSHTSSLNLQAFCCYNSYFRYEHSQNVLQCVFIILYIIGVGSGGGGGGGGGRGAGRGPVLPFLIGGGGNGMFVPPPTRLTPHFYFPLELYICITLTHKYLAFFIYQLIILWTISIN